MKEVSIYIATSIKGSWERNGYTGFVIEYHPQGGKYPVTRKPEYEEADCMTANRAELQALIRALSHMKEACSLTIYTESGYLYNGANNMNQWIKNGWRTSKGSEVKNRDLWEEIAGRLRGHMWRVLLNQPNAYIGPIKIKLNELEQLKAR